MEVDMSELELVLFDLKYCERCGGLWLREAGDDEVYCPGCVPVMAEFPVPRKRRKIEGLPVPEELQVEGRIELLLGLCGEGGTA
jgi:hypothetical protein